MPISMEVQVQKTIGRLPSQDIQTVKSLRINAMRMGEAAKPLLDAIDARLAEFDAGGGMAKHRLEFARSMLGLLGRRPTGQWVSSRDLFVTAKAEFSANPYVAYMAEKSARQMPLTKALDIVLLEFPNVERRKDGVEQSARVWFRRS